MKKLFISVPMKNRTKEEILESMDKLQTIAEVVIGEKLERIDTYIEEKPQFLADGEPSYYKKLMYLGESIKRMAQADVYVGVEYPPNFFAGCCVENQVAELYGLGPGVSDGPQYLHQIGKLHGAHLVDAIPRHFAGEGLGVQPSSPTRRAGLFFHQIHHPFFYFY